MRVTLPDGAELEVADDATGLDVAAAIGPRLAAATAAVRVDGELQDLRLPVRDGARVEIVRIGDADALPVLRHSTAHVLAEAARRAFPGVKISIGPAIDNGFYYDFLFPEPFTESDLPRLEQAMREILARGPHPYVREGVAREAARERFVAEGEPFKVELIDALPAGEQITFYTQDEFVDLCRGPHLQDTAPIKAFQLTSVAGAYWRGDSNREQLTRIYGTAFFSQADLDQHLERIEEAKRRDHRRLGPQLGLFQFHEEAAGSAFWLPGGMAVMNAIVDEARVRHQRHGYTEVKTPILYDAALWKVSGHWDKYRENMYTLDIDGRPAGMKAMNCPAHCLIYASERRSYRDLPIRLNEFGHVHRNEASGTLHGLMRVRGFTQDDAHLFVAQEQIQDEVAGVVRFALETYARFGLEDFRIELSTRPEQRVGDDAVWDQAEAALANALAALGIDHVVNEGDGAFYGPKIDFHLTDSLGRSWQCGTCQLDFNFPDRFDLTFTGSDDRDHRPVMIHRTLLGSLERFIGILIEHYAGALPLWLAPTQAVVLPISDRHNVYAADVVARLLDVGLRARTDVRSESIGKKIAEAEAGRVPVMLVVGDRELENGAVAMRRHGRRDEGRHPVADVVEQLAVEARR